MYPGTFVNMTSMSCPISGTWMIVMSIGVPAIHSTLMQMFIGYILKNSRVLVSLSIL